MAAPRTYLAPGQRYAQPDAPPWRAERQVTVLAVGRDEGGRPRVTCRYPGGARTVEPAAQLEAAIAAGQLVPVPGFGRLARC